ncbi:MAG: hypothetical protein WA322_09320 [Pseudolabrys sp.]
MRANVIGLLLIANVFYLFRSDPKAAPSRVVKLPNLWIDAKEQELKDRVRANKISAVAVPKGAGQCRQRCSANR